MPETCFAYPFPVFQPAMRIIAAITNGFPAQVTTTFNHQYVTGTTVRFKIPPGVGMQQLDGQFAQITVLTPTTFLVPIDTTNLNPFIIPSPPRPHYTCAQVVPFAENNAILTASVRNVLPYPAVP